MNKKKTTEQFIEEIKKIYGDKYDTSKVHYVNNRTKVCLICHEKNILGEEHGEFWVTPTKITSRHDGCPKCKGMYQTTEEFIAKAKLVHGDKYDYSKVEYINSKTKICIICPEHGEFWQLPNSHIYGQGCSKCVMSHLENKVKQMLDNNDINYIYEYNIKGILKRKNVDFYLPEYNTAIECQGGQHFYGGFNRNHIEKANEIHKNVLKRDIEKYNILKENNINVLYYTNITDLPKDIFNNKKYCKIYNENNFFIKLEDLLEKIREEK